jgi:hypothetical protein
MKNVKFIILLVIDFLIFIFELTLFKLFGKTGSNSSLHFLIKLHCLTNGIGTDLINSMVCKKKKIDLNFQSTENNVNIVNDTKQVIIFLKKEGYCAFNDAISIETVNSIKKSLINLKGQYFSDDYKSSENENLKEYNYKEQISIENPKAVKFQYSTNDLINIDEIQKLFSNKEIISLVQDYLNCMPILDLIEAWWSFPGLKPDSEAAQKWHFDMDRAKWVKVFFYLTECNDQNGPHYFINKTHISKSLPYSIRKLGYSRIDDEIVNNHYTKDEISKFIGKEGMMFFEDTRGLHKGSKVVLGNRLVLQFQYSSSLFPGKVNYLPLPKIKNENFLNLLDKNPILFSKFK